VIDLVDEYVDLSSNLPASPLFRKWAGIFGVAVMTRRRVWMVVPGFDEDMPLYPNFYILLVAPPAVGKTVAAKTLVKRLKTFNEVRFAPDDITGPRLVENLGDPKHKDAPEWIGGKLVKVTHRAAVVSEFATFLPRDDFKFMATLAALWDNEDVYEKETKTAGSDNLESLFVNILGGVQPAWFADQLPRGAFDQGLFARIIFIFNDDATPPKVAGRDRPDLARWDPWLGEMEKVLALKGEFDVPEVCHERMQAWIDGGMEPAPTHPLLANYRSRRHMHVYKLAMIHAISARRELSMTPEDIEWGIETLVQAEKFMPAALAVAGANPNRLYEEQAINVVLANWAKSKPTSETTIRRILLQNMPAHLVEASVDNMLASGRLGLQAGEKPNRMFKAGAYARAT